MQHEQHSIQLLYNLKYIDLSVYPLSLVLGALLFFWSKAFRQNRLVQLSFLWLIFYFGLQSVSNYNPPRYFQPLLIPLALLFSIAITTFSEYFKKRYKILILAVVLLIVGIYNGYQIVNYLSHPQYSFINMARETRDIICNENKNCKDVVLIGKLANSLSLETGIQSLNSSMGTNDLNWRLEKYKPQYYISLGLEPHIQKVLSKNHSVNKIKEWNVFNNYYYGQKVYLYKLIPK